MKQPPSIQPIPGPGPNYDPMDRLVEDLQNIEAFLLKLEENSEDQKYLSEHLFHILPLRRTISHQLDLLQEEPYSYSKDRLTLLHQENEKLFLQLEGAAGSKDPERFKKFIESAFHSLENFDRDLTPSQDTYRDG